MKIHCPVCNKENDVGYGKYICTDCKSKFEFTSNSKLRLIKRNKFDYLTLLYSITLPVMLLILLIYCQLASKSFDFPLFLIGLFFIISPFLIMIKRIMYRDNDALMIFYLYDKFFTKELKKEDSGRIISFYVIFLQNVLGLVFILIDLIK